MKFADGKTSSAIVPHLNVWGFDISAAEFPQQTKTRVFGVNRPLCSNYFIHHILCVAVITRRSELANTSPRHMPLLDNVHPIKIKNKNKDS